MPIVSETHSCIPSLLFAAGVPVEVFFAALHIPHQVELQKCDTKYKISFRWNCCFESCVVNRERKKNKHHKKITLPPGPMKSRVPCITVIL